CHSWRQLSIVHQIETIERQSVVGGIRTLRLPFALSKKVRRLLRLFEKYRSKWRGGRCCAEQQRRCSNFTRGLIGKDPAHLSCAQDCRSDGWIIAQIKTRRVHDARQALVRTARDAGISRPVCDRWRDPPRRKKRTRVFSDGRRGEFPQRDS